MTGVSTLSQIITQARLIQNQQSALSDLSTQLATGRKTQSFTGLGTEAFASQRSRTAFASLETYKNNIINAERRIELTLNAVQEFQQQANNFLDSIQGLAQESTHQKGDVLFYDDPATTDIENTQVGHDSAEPSIDLQLVIDYASNIIDTFESLMNVQDGDDRYLLSGAATSTQPITSTGTLTAAISTLITDWKDGSITTDDLIADLRDRTTGTNPNAITDSTVGYSFELANDQAGDVFVRVDDNLQINYTTLASEDAFRDIIVAVNYIANANLPPIADAYIPPNTPTPPFTPDVQGAPGADLDEQTDNFFAVINSLVTNVAEAIDDLDAIAFQLSQAQARVTEIRVNHEAEQNFLQGIIADVENVDQNEVALQLNTILSQVEASYAVTARVQQLSLVNFI